MHEITASGRTFAAERNKNDKSFNDAFVVVAVVAGFCVYVCFGSGLLLHFIYPGDERDMRRVFFFALKLARITEHINTHTRTQTSVLYRVFGMPVCVLMRVAFV